MILREYKSSDFTELRRIHQRSGVSYDFNLLRFEHRVVAEEQGRVVAALLGRPSEQVDLVLDKTYADPQRRWELIVELMAMGEAKLNELGISHEHCFVPQAIVKGYGKRLESLGFNREAGATFLKELR